MPIGSSSSSPTSHSSSPSPMCSHFHNRYFFLYKFCNWACDIACCNNDSWYLANLSIITDLIIGPCYYVLKQVWELIFICVHQRLLLEDQSYSVDFRIACFVHIVHVASVHLSVCVLGCTCCHLEPKSYLLCLYQPRYLG